MRAQMIAILVLFSAMSASPALAQEYPSPPAGQITDQTVLFNFRGNPITAGDLPGHSLSCRLYLARDGGSQLGALIRNQNPLESIKFLDRISMEIQFNPGWETADVSVDSVTYFFDKHGWGSLKLGRNRLPSHEYDTLKSIDPEHSQNPELRELAQKALKRTFKSDHVSMQGLTVRFADARGEPGNAIHIFDRISQPGFYMRVKESADPVYDEWMPELYGDMGYLKKGKVIPKYGQLAPLYAALTFALAPTTVGLLIAPGGLDGDRGVQVGAYCQLGTPDDLDKYESKPLGRESHQDEIKQLAPDENSSRHRLPKPLINSN